MLEAITKRLRLGKRAVSNVIVVMLSLVLIVIVVSNVVLWSYQMNQLDWDKTQETVTINTVSRLTRSVWFTVQSEFTVATGSRISGSSADTQTVNGTYESFRESDTSGTLDINGTFSIDISNYPLACINSVEILLRYRVSDTGERWYIKTYNWTTRTYSNSGFNSTSGHAPGAGWNIYTVNLTDKWQSYVASDGRMLIEVHDEGADATHTTIDIDFLAVRVMVNGAIFTFQNKGSRTVHLVSLWVNNSTQHRRYDTDEFANSGETFSYQRVDVSLPNGSFTVKVVTERGNTAVYTGA